MPRPVAIVLFLAAVTALALVVTDASVTQAIIASAAALLIMQIGLWGIKLLATPVPEPPEPGEMRKVKLLYRCEVCGSEVRMTSAASEDPPPPRHCMEDMELLNATD